MTVDISFNQDNFCTKDNPHKFVITKRRLSLTSILTDTNSNETKNRKRNSFKNLAKAYLLSNFKNFQECDSVSSNKQDVLKKSIVAKIHTRSGTKIYLEKNNSKELILTRNYKNNEDLINTPSSMQADIKLSSRDNNFDEYGVPNQPPELLCEGDYDPVYGELRFGSSDNDDENSGGESYDEDIDSIISPSIDNRRVVIFSGMPPTIGIQSLLNQVQGGPLENILIMDEFSAGKMTKRIELHFIHHKDAMKFVTYGRSHLFQVNGQHFTPKWASKKINKKSNESLNQVKEFLYDYMREHSTTNYEGACRSLILKKIGKGSIYQHCHDSTVVPDIVHIDINEIEKDFEMFGKIIEVVPMVSKKICLQIYYYDIRSAIKAFNNYETSYCYLNEKYSSEWSIWFGKDITDRPYVQV